jgi:PAS domain S-box-containing protein
MPQDGSEDGRPRDGRVVRPPARANMAKSRDHSPLDEDRLHAEEVRTINRLVENLNDVLFSLDLDGVLTYVSPAITRVSSYRPEEVVGRPFAALVHPDDHAALQASFLRILDGEVEPSEYRCLDKDGSVVWVRSSSRPLFENGEIRGVSGVFTDITPRRIAEEALVESEARYRQLVEMSPDMIAVHREGRFVFLNEAGVRLLGASGIDDVLGRSIFEFIAPETRPATVERIQDILDGGPPSSHQAQRLRRLDGTVVEVEVAAMALSFRGAPAVHVVVRDVSERRRAEAQLRRAQETLEQRVRSRTAELESANRELESFSYSVSHDLRAPLRVIEGFSRMFLDEFADAVDPTARDYIDRVHATSVRMGELIRDILSLARVSRVAMSPARVDLSAIAATVIADLRQVSPKREVEVVLAEGLVVDGDPSLLRVMLENLLGNAWKYSGRLPRARIEFGARETEEGTEYFVRDDGAGFDMRDAGKLFGAFQRLHPESEFEGTGIGLATVQRIVQRHGGRVWAEAVPDHGATFSFTLPSIFHAG